MTNVSDQQGPTHDGERISIHYPCPGEPTLPVQEAVVRLDRLDHDGTPGEPVVAIGAMTQDCHGEPALSGLHPDWPMGLDDAERLAHAILAAVASGRETDR